MRPAVNIASSQHQIPIIEKISHRVQAAMVSYSELQDKGRFFSSIDFMHFIHQVLPCIVQSTIKDYVEEVEAK